MDTTTVLTTLDWSLIAILLLCSLGVGFFVKDKASEGGVEGFSLPAEHALVVSRHFHCCYHLCL